ncbi:MAG: class I SAM-dependent methyltransferase [Gemmatimonadota bacterium]|nr:class I SAM-dependent methyltransferase [Gemmatimonadota bacterium]
MGLPRLHVFELEDLPWFPATIRDLATDYLRFMSSRLSLHRPMVPLIAGALRESGETRLVDLCSGGGGPVLDIQRELGAEGLDVEVLLTDLYPNVSAFEGAKAAASGRVSYLGEPVDATRVDPRLPGCRTLFNGFHHFAPAEAEKILADAATDRRPIAIFEIPERSLLALVPFLFTPVFVWLTTPLIRPFRWSRLFWTYILPLVPVTCWWDGIVSHLRAYTVPELESLAAKVEVPGYRWRAGRTGLERSPGNVTYLIGVPDLLSGSASA